MEMSIEAGLRAGRAPNGLILTGAGREARAQRLTAAYLCAGATPPCEGCAHCRKVRLGIHPDVMTVGSADQSLKVDEIRAMRRDAVIRPGEAERKVYLLPRADTMNPSGQNALLKLLEEGPDYAAFFLLTPNPDLLLPTVRSRCQMLHCGAEPAQQEQQASERALQFSQLLCEEGPVLKLVEFLVGLEKCEREEMTRLLDETVALLLQRCTQNPAHILPRLESVEQVRAACQTTNISSAHLVGWLMAGLC